MAFITPRLRAAGATWPEDTDGFDLNALAKTFEEGPPDARHASPCQV
jgi:hypothetical protein